jgi:hypothetical protein
MRCQRHEYFNFKIKHFQSDAIILSTLIKGTLAPFFVAIGVFARTQKKWMEFLTSQIQVLPDDMSNPCVPSPRDDLNAALTVKIQARMAARS